MADKLEQLKNKTILFLEDNIEFANNTIVLFHVFVKATLHATTIEEALSILNSHSIDIIISDIKLKQENGLDFIKKIRENDTETPIIILSGHKDEAFLFRSIPLNLTAYLLKPIKYDELIEALEKCSDKIGFHQQSMVHLKEDWYFDTAQKNLLHGEKKHTLNRKEALFIEMISLNRDRLITKEMFQSYVWEEDEMSDSAITNFIMRIRRRFGKEFIYTIPDLGYRFKL